MFIRITNRLESDEVTEDMATPEDILSGKKAWVDGNQITGTMMNRGTVNQTLKAVESYTIPEGYHDGNGVISSDSLASQTPGTATAEDIRNGEIAWVNGVETTGTATEFTNTTNESNLSYDVSMYDSVTIYAYSYNGTEVKATNLKIELK